ncbi:MAG: glycosyl hydrolase family 18 protein, partial [Candidatus Dojkabacteria bacterium]|nr:glycosyl hydrolase family 18 protein [Candidatus Dojkabacteria bacterium]
MYKKKFFLTILILLCSIIVIIGTYIFVKGNILRKKTVYKLEKSVAVYIPWWDQDDAFTSLKENSEYIRIIHPFWYEVKNDGSISKFTGAEDEDIIKFCKDNDILIIPAISNEQDPDTLNKIFISQELTSTHIKNISDLIESNDYDGIDIDYESMNAQDRDNFSNFITLLSNELSKEDRMLTVAVHAKTSDYGTWDGPASQDWGVLNTYADRINIMAYDYHWSTSEAGDIAPLSWIREVLSYAVTVIDEEKISLGVHTYGYDWVDKTSESYTYKSIQELIDDNGVTEITMSDEYEKYFTYDDNHTVYFADASTLSKRLELIQEYNISGISIWRIGDEDMNIWVEIANQL